MYKKLEVLNKIQHKSKGVAEVTDFLYSKNLINAPIALSEFFEACKNYPIFFAKLLFAFTSFFPINSFAFALLTTNFAISSVITATS